MQSTVIGCLTTDTQLSRADAARAADLAHTGIARSITPGHTSHDGDVLCLCSAQRVDASVDPVADLAARAVAAATRSAVRHADSMHGLPRDPRTLTN